MGSSTDREFIQLIKDNPVRFKKIILNTFNTEKEAFDHEIILHKIFDVAHNKYFYNKANQLHYG